MAWNEPGGGKKRDPWDRRGSDGDVDAFLEKLKGSLGRVFGGGDGRPGGGGGGLGGFGWIIGALFAFWLVFDSWQLIDERERGVVLRFGEFHRILAPGANFKWPRPVERVIKVDVGQVRSVSDQVRMLSRDENIVNIEYNVQYRVADPALFLFGSRDPEDTLKAAAESSVREVMGNTAMDEILTGQRAQLAADASRKLQVSLDQYRTGLLVSEFNVQNARPPQEVKDAFDDAITAREDRERIENEAEAYASKVVPEARGQAARVRQEAEGYKAAKVAQAQGDAARFELLAAEYRRAPEVTRQRLYLETMESVLGGSRKVLVDDSGNNVLYLPLDGGGRGSAETLRERLPAVVESLSPSGEERPAREARRSGRDGER
ncbi:MAG TPA: FtsH protease activity modulator HflK [Xanthomonadaceae bacterium]|nr:FtsH protease activity modulator HflK [Xanthomonadaceae bacterium]